MSPAKIVVSRLCMIHAAMISILADKTPCFCNGIPCSIEIGGLADQWCQRIAIEHHQATSALVAVMKVPGKVPSRGNCRI